jgi:hypothetical protein
MSILIRRPLKALLDSVSTALPSASIWIGTNTGESALNPVTFNLTHFAKKLIPLIELFYFFRLRRNY